MNNISVQQPNKLGSISEQCHGLQGVVQLQCPFTKVCCNNRCFFKQRDSLGFCPFPMYPGPNNDFPALRANQQILEIYGSQITPKWSMFLGTNVLNMYCKDFMYSNGNQPNRYDET